MIYFQAAPGTLPNPIHELVVEGEGRKRREGRREGLMYFRAAWYSSKFLVAQGHIIPIHEVGSNLS
jgi:hypothetical protein